MTNTQLDPDSMVLGYLIDTNRKLINNLVGQDDKETEERLEALKQERDSAENLLAKAEQQLRDIEKARNELTQIIVDERAQHDSELDACTKTIKEQEKEAEGREQKLTAENTRLKEENQKLLDRPATVINPDLDNIVTFIEVALAAFYDDPDRAHRSLNRAFLAIQGRLEEEQNNE